MVPSLKLTVNRQTLSNPIKHRQPGKSVPTSGDVLVDNTSHRFDFAIEKMTALARVSLFIPGAILGQINFITL